MAMYKKILVPLDGSKTAENVLPYARYFARNLQIPVELLAVVDVVEMTRNISAAEGLFLDTLIDHEAQCYHDYLKEIGKNFPMGCVQYRVEKGKAAEIIVESAKEMSTLIAMATHGRSGLNRWLVGSVAEKVLRAAANPLLLVRGKEETPRWNMVALKSIVVPLDGSELAESILPYVEQVAKNLDLEVVLLRVYALPYCTYSSGQGFYDATQIETFLASLRVEALDYLEGIAADLKKRGLEKVSVVVKQGLDADEIIGFACHAPDSLVAMCSHGRSGVKRWVLGSVTETVVRHSGDPVLVLRAAS
jgi:nucleotide-binding universal stress UspA family protein